MNSVHVAMIADANYVLPSSVTIYSILNSKTTDTDITIHLLASDLRDDQKAYIKQLEQYGGHIDIISISADKYAEMHSFDRSAICVASIAALLKFDLPQVLGHLDKVLYLDGDMIIRSDLCELYCTDLGNNYVAAVEESGTLYYRHEYAEKVSHYFNSGVMLLNLEKMRQCGATEMLIQAKLDSGDSMLMDQNIFNLVFDGQIQLLPVTWNCNCVSLNRAAKKWTIEDVNERYGTDYKNKNELFDTANILHYSSYDKPWKFENVFMDHCWLKYREGLFETLGTPPILYKKETLRTASIPVPVVSVIVPVYNSMLYLEETIHSLENQTLHHIEFIFGNDGSTDDSLQVLLDFADRDDRVTVISQTNGGASAARNAGMEVIRGKYTYFFDSDDLLLPDALEKMLSKADADNLEILTFNGEVFFDNEEDEEKFPDFREGRYIYANEYPGIISGKQFFVEQQRNSELSVVVYRFFFRTDFLKALGVSWFEGVIYEDNLFAIQVLMGAKRVEYMNEIIFRRRVHPSSVMTNAYSYYHFRSRMLLLTEIVKFVAGLELNSAEASAVSGYLQYYTAYTGNTLTALPPKERLQPRCENSVDKFLCDMLYQSVVRQAESRDYERKYLKEVASQKKTKKSLSYRIGRAVTWLPRKIRDMSI